MRFERDMLAAADAFVGGDDAGRAAIGDTAGEAVGREAAEDDRMNRADARAGEHRRRGLGNHRHVDHHAVAALHPALEEQVGQAAGLVEQFAVSDGAAFAGLVGLEDERRLVAMLGDVAVEAIDGEVERPVLEPADAEVRLAERPIAGDRRHPVPRQAPGLIEPELVGVGGFAVVELLKFERSDPGLEVVRDRMDRWFQSPRPMSITKR